MKRLAFVAVCAIGLSPISAFAAAEQFNVDELPRLTITLPDKSKAELIKYQDRDWRVVKVAVLAGDDDSAGDVCFETKFEAVIGTKLKMIGDAGSIIIEDKEKLRKIKELKLGDNVWICGSLRKEGRTLNLYAVHVLKQLPDRERYRIRIEGLAKAGNYERLLTLGHEIDEQKKNNRATDLIDFDAFSELRDRAWDRGLTMWESKIKPDDADELFAVACKWRDLLRKKSKFQTLARQVLKIDPRHQGASAIADRELGLKLFENKWLPPAEIERIVADRKRQAERMDQSQKEEHEARERARLQAIAERPALLNKFQSAMRTSNVSAREGAIKSLGEEIAKSPDKGFGSEAVEILANLSDQAAVMQSLERAAASTFPETRTQVYEALVWRGSQKAPDAFEILVRALQAEKDADAAKSAVYALAALGGKTATGTLVSALSSPEQSVRDEYIDGLKQLTKLQIGSKDAWEDWWTKNKDTLDDSALR
jgi:hypothetical protein